MHMPSPGQGASHGNHPTGAMHLVCRCQRGRAPRLSLCGFEVDDDSPRARRDVDAQVCARYLSDPLLWCAVCTDLARTAIDVGACERCL